MSGPDKIMENKGWEQMSKTLDVELPKKKRRPVFWWFTFAILAMITVLFIMTSKDTKTDKSTAQKNIEIAQANHTTNPLNDVNQTSHNIRQNTSSSSLNEIEDKPIIPVKNSEDLKIAESIPVRIAHNKDMKTSDGKIKNIATKTVSVESSENREERLSTQGEALTLTSGSIEGADQKSIIPLDISDKHTDSVDPMKGADSDDKRQFVPPAILWPSYNMNRVLKSKDSDKKVALKPMIVGMTKPSKGVQSTLMPLVYAGSGMLVKDGGFRYGLGVGLEWQRGDFFMRSTLGIDHNLFHFSDDQELASSDVIIVTEGMSQDVGDPTTVSFSNTSDLLKSSTSVAGEFMVGRRLFSNFDFALGINASSALNYNSVAGEVQHANGSFGPFDLNERGEVENQSFFEKFDYGLSANLEYRLTDQFRVGLRYKHGFNSLIKEDFTSPSNTFTTSENTITSENVNKSIDLRCYYNF